MTKFSFLTLFALALGLFGLAGGPAHAFPVATPPGIAASEQPGLIIPAKSNFHGGFPGGFPGGFNGVGHGGRYYGHGGYYGNRYYGNRYYRNRYYGRRCYGWNGFNCNGYYGGPFLGLGFGFGSGYYYAPNYYYAPSRGYSSRHVAWCKNRYRSYNVRSNTWVANSGKVRKCKSPYWP